VFQSDLTHSWLFIIASDLIVLAMPPEQDHRLHWRCFVFVLLHIQFCVYIIPKIMLLPQYCHDTLRHNDSVCACWNDSERWLRILCSGSHRYACIA